MITYAIHKIVLSRPDGPISIPPLTCTDEMTETEFMELSAMGAVRAADSSETALFYLANPTKSVAAKSVADTAVAETPAPKVVKAAKGPKPVEPAAPVQQDLDLG